MIININNINFYIYILFIIMKEASALKDIIRNHIKISSNYERL
jgi:hypothetical protein